MEPLLRETVCRWSWLLTRHWLLLVVLSLPIGNAARCEVPPMPTVLPVPASAQQPLSSAERSGTEYSDLARAGYIEEEYYLSDPRRFPLNPPIIVNAQKRQEGLQEVPMSIEALSTEPLEELRAPDSSRVAART